ncbi:helix-turn-helix domain-containing protein [Amycolatopsis circi]|uniref:helix-turn-helix domain-containing protein n=1 Tax=Amycolatopsis circi TaxID=871959 RepID=UPI000E26DBAA
MRPWHGAISKVALGPSSGSSWWQRWFAGAQKLQTWRAIRATAFELIGERGFEAVSVEEIAAAADVSRSTFVNAITNPPATSCSTAASRTSGSFSRRSVLNCRQEARPSPVFLLPRTAAHDPGAACPTRRLEVLAAHQIPRPHRASEPDRVRSDCRGDNKDLQVPATGCRHQ